MKIEKGKLYVYNGVVEMPMADMDVEDGLYSDKIAVHCPTKEDWDYVNNSMGPDWEWSFNEKCVYRILDKENFRPSNQNWPKENYYHIITIDEFKKFYPDHSVEPKGSFKKIVDLTPVNDDLLNNYGDEIGAILESQKENIDPIVHIVTEKYKQRSKVGLEKYGTDLNNATFGIRTALTHLQEELMDATLYIEKLKQQIDYIDHFINAK